MKIAFCGDIMPGAEVAERVGHRSLAEWLSDVAPAWSDADALIGNLECPCVTSARPIPKPQAELELWSPASRVRELAEAGFTAVTLANNHVLDCGAEGLQETLRALDDAGIRHTGAGMTLKEALEPALLHIGEKTLGVVAFTYGPPAGDRHPGAAPFDRRTMAKGLSKARASCDVLVAALHDGLEYSDVPPGSTRERFRFLAENGADIVVGHHPHVLQGIERHRGVPMAYSLGDLLFHNSLPAVTSRNFGRMALTVREPEEARRDPAKFSRGAILTIEVSPHRDRTSTWHPFRQDALRPRLCAGEARTEDLRRLDALSHALLDPSDPRHALADRVVAAGRKAGLAALPWQEVKRLARRPKWRYLPRGASWLAARLKNAVLRAL